MKATIRSRNYRRYGRQILNGLAAFALLLAGASNAVAGCTDEEIFTVDTKVFPGTMCRQLGAASTVYYDGNGRVLNPSTSSVTVICPIVRDASTEKWARIRVVVADRNPNANVTCSARSNQTDGLGWSYNPNNPLPAGFFDLNWWVSKTLEFSPPVDERDEGTYFVSCTIPRRYSNGSQVYDSGVYSYRVHECSGKTDPN